VTWHDTVHAFYYRRYCIFNVNQQKYMMQQYRKIMAIIQGNPEDLPSLISMKTNMNSLE